MIRHASFLFVFIIFCGVIFGISPFARAETTIETLKAKIVEYEKQYTALGTQKTTLQSTIKGLTLKQKQLSAQIKITQTKIAAANTQIKSLTNSIGDKEESIVANQDAIAKALRVVAQDEKASLVTQLISSYSLQEAWQAADVTLQFNRALGDNINKLRTVRTELSKNRESVKSAKDELMSLQTDLNAQNKLIVQNKAQQQRLLTQTQSSEVTFQKLLAAAKAELAAFSAFTTAAGGSKLLTNQTICDDWGCYYNQRDSGWGNIPLSGTSERFAATGCLVTAMAMVLTHYGYNNVNPMSINSNPANFSAVGGLMLFTTYVAGITAKRIAATIDATLSIGHPVIVGIHAYGGTHFVVLVSGKKGSYTMRDPYIANGKDVNFSEHYTISSIYAVNKVIIST